MWFLGFCIQYIKFQLLFITVVAHQDFALSANMCWDGGDTDSQLIRHQFRVLFPIVKAKGKQLADPRDADFSITLQKSCLHFSGALGAFHIEAPLFNVITIGKKQGQGSRAEPGWHSDRRAFHPG